MLFISICKQGLAYESQLSFNKLFNLNLEIAYLVFVSQLYQVRTIHIVFNFITN